MHRAADETAVSQSAISKSIKTLEDSLGVKLFDRSAKGVSVTKYGELLYRRASRIESECQALEQELNELTSGHAGSLSIAAGPAWTAHLLPIAISRLHEERPLSNFTLIRSSSPSSLKLLQNNEIDVAIGALADARAIGDEFQSRPLLHVEMRVMASKSHPLFKSGKVNKRDLLRYPWVLFRSDDNVFENVNEFFFLDQLDPPDCAIMADSFITVLELLNTRPMLTCMADPLLPIAHMYKVDALPAIQSIWSFDSGCTYR
ncbi:MAG: LysR family transcriptional regulator, partial [Desulfobulbia bacterium]